MRHLTFERPEETAGVQVQEKDAALESIFDDLQHACEHTQDILNLSLIHISEPTRPY